MKVKKVAVLGLCVALAMIMSYIESLFPLNLAVPGTPPPPPPPPPIFLLYRVGFSSACIVSLIRVFLVSMLFGNVMMMAYSIAGAVLSLAVMFVLKKCGKFSVVGVSIAGGVAHNAGQIIMAVILLGAKQIAYYLPVLAVTGTVTGVLIGIAASVVIKRVKHI